MFCYIRRDLSTYLQLSLCLSALLNWGQHFSSPSVSLTLTVPDVQEIQAGAAVLTYRHFFSLQTVAASILQHGRSVLDSRVRTSVMHLRAPVTPHPLGAPRHGAQGATCGETEKRSHLSGSVKTPPRSLLCLYFYCFLNQDIFSIIFCMFIKDACFVLIFRRLFFF